MPILKLWGLFERPLSRILGDPVFKKNNKYLFYKWSFNRFLRLKIVARALGVLLFKRCLSLFRYHYHIKMLNINSIRRICSSKRSTSFHTSNVSYEAIQTMDYENVKVSFSSTSFNDIYLSSRLLKKIDLESNWVSSKRFMKNHWLKLIILFITLKALMLTDKLGTKELLCLSWIVYSKWE